MIKYNKEIHQKALNKNDSKAYLLDCLNVNICPVCGGKVEKSVTPEKGLAYQKIKFKCKNKDFKAFAWSDFPDDIEIKKPKL